MEKLVPIEIFILCAHEDIKLRKRLEKHLSSLKRQEYLSIWHEQNIWGGKERKAEIDTHLHRAHIILLLFSPDFIASDDYFSSEIKEAIKRHKDGLTHVIPIILRPVYWKNGIFDDFHALPSNGKPITLWSNRDAAFLDVVTGIVETIKDIQSPSSKTHQAQEHQDYEGSILLNLKEHESTSTTSNFSYIQKSAKSSPYLETFNTLMQAISQRNRIIFAYHVANQKKGVLHKNIEPHYITYVDGHFYLIGYSNKLEHLIEFRIDRIVPKSIKIEVYYVIPNHSPHPVTFRYWVDADFAANPLNQRWLTSVVEREEITQDTSGITKKQILIRATAYNEFHIIQQLLTYSPKVELVDPPHLRKQLREIIKQMYQHYHP